MNKDAKLLKEMGDRVRFIRNEMKLTKEALGRKMGVTGQFLGVVESGKSSISYDKLKKLCDISGYSADYILFGKNADFFSKAKEQISQFDKDQIEEACEIIQKLAIFMKNDLSKFVQEEKEEIKEIDLYDDFYKI